MVGHMPSNLVWKKYPGGRDWQFIIIFYHLLEFSASDVRLIAHYARLQTQTDRKMIII